ncbi:MAG TPA: CbtB domain-containing protein [Chloroflexota bacterium]|jgi:hypothetical protein|nr:CbtB domain-containing protein [Chloroflexota bacterium]
MPGAITLAIPRVGPQVLAGLLGAFAIYVLGLDQGLLLSIVQGQAALDQNLIHELIHDARHAAAFPCH